MKKTFSLLILIAILSISCMKLGLVDLTKEQQDEIINELCSTIREGYVYENLSDSIATAIETNHGDGMYREALDPSDFGKLIDKDLLKTSKDGHIWFAFSPGYVNKLKRRKKAGDSYTRSDIKRIKKINYGFKEFEILENNIGYIDITSFVDTTLEVAKETALNALKKMADSKAIIIDLRNCRGGYGSMVDLISSHFYQEKTLISTVINRRDDEITENWSIDVDMPKLEQPLYILVSDITFSAAEALAYGLKHHNRATIIGQKTAGGAHMSQRIVVWEHFVLQLPIIRGEHPKTGRDWEKTGVIPDIEIKNNLALDRAIEEIKKL